jgi:hypothetical protein
MTLQELGVRFEEAKGELSHDLLSTDIWVIIGVLGSVALLWFICVICEDNKTSKQRKVAAHLERKYAASHHEERGAL